ncbi:MAG TPA: hypothetical protein VN253_09575 [Kofleriaceae bacterium]|nr:hypothetical protein [Kofleriaceae bacterium]
MTRTRLARLVPLALALAGTAHADKKLQELKPDFAREVAGCQVQTNGIAKVLAGATELAKTAEPDERAELERDVEQLTRGLALEKEYCDEVAAMIAFIDANAAAPYRSVERELDARYTKIVKLRAATKKMLEELQPTTRKVIPRMSRRPPPAAPEPKRVPGKFPSGRTVELPALPGTWRLSGSSTTDTADYGEAPPKGPAIAGSATTRPFSGATCDQQRKALLVRADADGLIDLDLPGAKELGVAWGARYTRREQTTVHLVSVLCVPGKTGGLLATADVVPADRTTLAEELAKLLLQMIAAQKP